MDTVREMREEKELAERLKKVENMERCEAKVMAVIQFEVCGWRLVLKKKL